MNTQANGYSGFLRLRVKFGANNAKNVSKVRNIFYIHILKKNFCALLTFFIHNIVGNIFKEVLYQEMNPRQSRSRVKVYNRQGILPHSCACANSLAFEKNKFFLRNNHILTKVIAFSGSTSEIKAMLPRTLFFILLTSTFI